MKIALTLFLLLTATFSSIADGRLDSPQKTRQDLVQQFKERRKHKAPLTGNREDILTSLSAIKKDGNLRKKIPSNGRNAAASRLSLSEMQRLVVDMRAKLKKVESGELSLKDKEKERYERFIKRFEELQGDHAGAKDIKPLARNKRNKHSEEFIETQGLVLGKTYEEREAVADHIRKELADHEAGLRVMDDKLYEVKKRALLRYDRVYHSETVNSTKMDEKKSKKKKLSRTSELNDSEDVALDTNGKTSEAANPDALEAPPRYLASSNSKENEYFGNGIVYGEEAKRLLPGDPRKTPEEKELFRRNEASVKMTQKVHGDGRQRES